MPTVAEMYSGIINPGGGMVTGRENDNRLFQSGALSQQEVDALYAGMFGTGASSTPGRLTTRSVQSVPIDARTGLPVGQQMTQAAASEFYKGILPIEPLVREDEMRNAPKQVRGGGTLADLFSTPRSLPSQPQRTISPQRAPTPAPAGNAMIARTFAGLGQNTSPVARSAAQAVTPQRQPAVPSYSPGTSSGRAPIEVVVRGTNPAPSSPRVLTTPSGRQYISNGNGGFSEVGGPNGSSNAGASAYSSGWSDGGNGGWSSGAARDAWGRT